MTAQAPILLFGSYGELATGKDGAWHAGIGGQVERMPAASALADRRVVGHELPLGAVATKAHHDDATRRVPGGVSTKMVICRLLRP